MQNLEFSGPTEAGRLEPKLLPAAPNWDPTGKLQIQTWENPLLTLRALYLHHERLGESVSIFRALTEVIGTTMRASRMMMPTVGAFAEVRRPMLREGTKAGFATKDIVMVRNECGPTAAWRCVSAGTSGLEIKANPSFGFPAKN